MDALCRAWADRRRSPFELGQTKARGRELSDDAEEKLGALSKFLVGESVVGVLGVMDLVAHCDGEREVSLGSDGPPENDRVYGVALGRPWAVQASCRMPSDGRGRR